LPPAIIGIFDSLRSATRSVSLQWLDLHRKNEPGEPNGVTITTCLSGSNCLRRLAA